MGLDDTPAERDYESFCLLMDLWARENPVKTAKLLVLLTLNAILVSALCVAGGLMERNWPIPLAGAAFSFVFILSIGRTTLFQEVWRMKLREIAGRYPQDARFHVPGDSADVGKVPRLPRALGSVPSRYYLLGIPIILTSCWAGALVYLLI